MIYKFIDLFCGGGGLSLGFKHAGFKHLFGVDNWIIAYKAYLQNVGEIYYKDVKYFNGSEYKGKVDVIVGSPPCKTFSKANIKTRSCDMTLTDEFFRVIDEIKPKAWVMENVPEVLPFIDAPFKELFDMSEYGLLQKRKRCIASNMKLNLTKEEHKYLTDKKIDKQIKFREKAIHNLYQTITARYNSFTKASPHIRDENGIRVLSHTEALQIQTFPFYYKLPVSISQRDAENLIGNAVPPLFAYQIGKSLMRKLEE